MPGQEQIRHQHRDDHDGDVPEPAAAAPTTQTTDSDIDGILDEIDSVLESNSEEFVRGFVQKGGQ